MICKSKERIHWIDIAKGLAILFVVIGHIIHDGSIRQIIYSFHVPLWFFLAGMTCKMDKIIERIKADFVRIMIPYYCFGIISVLVFWMIGQYAAEQLNMNIDTSIGYNFLRLFYASSLNNGMKFNTPLWFLPCLFVVKIMYYFLYKVCKGKESIILIMSLVFLTLGFIYTYFNWIELPFNLSVALKMLFFFCVGKTFLEFWSKSKMHILETQSFMIGSIMMIGGALIAVCNSSFECSLDQFPNVLTFLLTSSLGSLGICFISIGIGKCKSLEYVGKRTLAILTMHKFPILLFQTIEPTKTLLLSYKSFKTVIVQVVIVCVTVALCLIAEFFIINLFPLILGKKQNREDKFIWQ